MNNGRTANARHAKLRFFPSNDASGGDRGRLASRSACAADMTSWKGRQMHSVRLNASGAYRSAAGAGGQLAANKTQFRRVRRRQSFAGAPLMRRESPPGGRARLARHFRVPLAGPRAVALAIAFCVAQVSRRPGVIRRARAQLCLPRVSRSPCFSARALFTPPGSRVTFRARAVSRQTWGIGAKDVARIHFSASSRCRRVDYLKTTPF